MGLDISVNLIIGVPLLRLGSIEREEESRQLVNGLGEPKGRPVTLRNIYLMAKNGKRFLIGSNVRSLADGGRDRIEFRFYELFGSDEEVDDWLWQSDYEGDLEQVIVGRVPKPIDMLEIRRREAYKIFRSDETETIQDEVKKKLMEAFGYSGEVYIIAQVAYSY